MEQYGNSQSGGSKEAKVDYSVGVGAREEIRRPRTDSTASQTAAQILAW